MSDDCAHLRAKAEANAASLRFVEVQELARCHGWELSRQKGSHVMYKRTGTIQPMNFQNVKGMAKAYQVRQLLRAIEEIEEQSHE